MRTSVALGGRRALDGRRLPEVASGAGPRPRPGSPSTSPSTTGGFLGAHRDGRRRSLRCGRRSGPDRSGAAQDGDHQEDGEAHAHEPQILSAPAAHVRRAPRAVVRSWAVPQSPCTRSSAPGSSPADAENSAVSSPRLGHPRSDERHPIPPAPRKALTRKRPYRRGVCRLLVGVPWRPSPRRNHVRGLGRSARLRGSWVGAWLRRNDRPDRLALPDPREARRRRHGCRLQGRGHPARPPRRPEVPARGALRRPRRPRALSARSPGGLGPESPPHLHHLRHRRARGAALHRHGAARRARR